MSRGWLIWGAALLLAALLTVAACDEDEDPPDVWQGDDDDDVDDDDDDDEWVPPTCELAEVSLLPLPGRDSPNSVTFDESGRAFINGDPIFPLGFYGVDGDDADMDEVAGIGFNNAENSMGCCQGDSLQNHIDYINAAEDAGLFAWVHGFSPHSQVQSVERETLNQWIAARAGLPGLLGWYTFDEPGLWQVDPDVVRQEHELLNEQDPDHPTILVDMASVPYETYIDYCNVFMVDPYPIPFMPIGLVTTQIQAALEAAQGRGTNGGVQPIWGVLQSFDWKESWGAKPPDEPWRPTAAEMRSMSYQAIAAGAQGIVYFAFRYLRESTEWEGFAEFAQELSALNSIWVSDTLDSAGLLIDEERTSTIVMRLFDYEGRNYLLAVNNGQTSTKATFDLTSLGANPCAIDYFDEQVRPIGRDGRFTEVFEYMGVRLYQITDEAKGGCR